MRNEIIANLKKQPFEEVVAIACRQSIQIKYDPKFGGYYCTYWVGNSEFTTAANPQIKLAVAEAIVLKIESETQYANSR